MNKMRTNNDLKIRVFQLPGLQRWQAFDTGTSISKSVEGRQDRLSGDPRKAVKNAISHHHVASQAFITSGHLAG
jgi:hypothetical protein